MDDRQWIPPYPAYSPGDLGYTFIPTTTELFAEPSYVPSSDLTTVTPSEETFSEYPWNPIDQDFPSPMSSPSFAMTSRRNPAKLWPNDVPIGSTIPFSPPSYLSTTTEPSPPTISPSPIPTARPTSKQKRERNSPPTYSKKRRPTITTPGTPNMAFYSCPATPMTTTPYSSHPSPSSASLLRTPDTTTAIAATPATTITTTTITTPTTEPTKPTTTPAAAPPGNNTARTALGGVLPANVDPRAAAERIRREAWRRCRAEADAMARRRLLLLERDGGALDREVERLRVNYLGLVRARGEWEREWGRREGEREGGGVGAHDQEGQGT